jgi:hypothetical protein
LLSLTTQFSISKGNSFRWDLSFCRSAFIYWILYACSFYRLWRTFCKCLLEICSILPARRVDFAWMSETIVRIFWTASSSSECLPACPLLTSDRSFVLKLYLPSLDDPSSC